MNEIYIALTGLVILLLCFSWLNYNAARDLRNQPTLSTDMHERECDLIFMCHMLWIAAGIIVFVAIVHWGNSL